MARDRLTSRIAEDMKSKAGSPTMDKGTGINNDPYAMNETGHEKSQPKVDSYAKGDPESWNEGVNKDNPAKDDHKREETGHAPLIDKHAAENAVAAARKLEEKGVKCIVASQRVLPGAPDKTIEAQAAEFMHYPDNFLNSLLTRQEELAQSIAKSASETVEAAKGMSEEQKENFAKMIAKKKKARKEKEAAEMDKEASELATEFGLDKEAVKAEMDKDEADDEEAAKACKKDEAEDEEASKKDAKKDMKKDEAEDEEAAKACKKDEAEDEEASKKDAKKDMKKDEAEDEEAAKACKKDEAEDEEASKKKESKLETEDKEASEDSLLDQIFGLEVTASDKKGATKLSGMVKKEASTNVDSNMSSLWNSAPDVSKIFQ